MNMSDIFVISDTHFNHVNMLTFKSKDGSLIRPNFKDVDHMNEIMINNWNTVIKPDDQVIHVGDVIFGRSDLYGNILARLNGIKTLIMGNHDYDAAKFIPYFSNIRSSYSTKNEFKREMLFTHYPVDAYSLPPNTLNVHGHIHEKKIDNENYLNVCVERTNYRPIPIEDIIEGKFR